MVILTFVSLMIDCFDHFYSSLPFCHLYYLPFWISLELQVRIHNMITTNGRELTVYRKNVDLLNLLTTLTEVSESEN